MSREMGLKIYLFAFLSIFLAANAAPFAFAQKENTPAVPAAKPKGSATTKTGMPATTTKPQVIETEVTEDNVFDLEDPEPTDNASQDQKKNPSSFSEDEKQFIRINQSLKNLIEENKKLFKQKDDLQKDIEDLRGERMVQETRLRALANERADLLKRSEEINNIKASYEKEIEDLKKELGSVKQDPVVVAPEASGELSMQEAEAGDALGSSAQEAAKPIDVVPAPALTQAASNELGSLMEENAILRKDTIKLHYNLANLFFEQGKYDFAVAEYKRVADLMPQDAATHYNLAFVSAEYLKDYKTAIAHYKKYVKLEPQADDAAFVKNQILELQLRLRNQTDSYIDKDTGDFDLPQK